MARACCSGVRPGLDDLVVRTSGAARGAIPFRVVFFSRADFVARGGRRNRDPPGSRWVDIRDLDRAALRREHAVGLLGHVRHSLSRCACLRAGLRPSFRATTVREWSCGGLHGLRSGGSQIGLHAIHFRQHKGEFLTGLLYVDAQRKDFVTLENMTDTPLARLPDEALRPSEAVLKKIMETI